MATFGEWASVRVRNQVVIRPSSATSNTCMADYEMTMYNLIARCEHMHQCERFSGSFTNMSPCQVKGIIHDDELSELKRRLLRKDLSSDRLKLLLSPPRADHGARSHDFSQLAIECDKTMPAIYPRFPRFELSQPSVKVRFSEAALDKHRRQGFHDSSHRANGFIYDYDMSKPSYRGEHQVCTERCQRDTAADLRESCESC